MRHKNRRKSTDDAAAARARCLAGNDVAKKSVHLESPFTNERIVIRGAATIDTALDNFAPEQTQIRRIELGISPSEYRRKAQSGS